LVAVAGVRERAATVARVVLVEIDPVGTVAERAAVSVRDMVKEIQIAMRSGDLMPAEAREHLQTLTALLGNCNDEQRDADAAYSQVLLGCLNSEKTANRARINAEITPEYMRKREAKDVRDQVVEMIRSLKTVLRSLSDEMSLQR
jgi:hypothetical protein